MLKILGTATAASLLALSTLSFAQTSSRCQYIAGAEEQKCLNEERAERAGAIGANTQAVSITPEQLKWSQSPASPSETTMVIGDRQGGSWVSRARFKQGMRVMPHSHPIDIQV